MGTQKVNQNASYECFEEEAVNLVSSSELLKHRSTTTLLGIRTVKRLMALAPIKSFFVVHCRSHL